MSSSDIADQSPARAQPADENAQPPQRLSLKPLLTLKPLIFAHKAALWGAAEIQVTVTFEAATTPHNELANRCLSQLDSFA